MQIQPLQPGDIMMEGGDEHAVIWVRDDKPIAHASNGSFFGVIQQNVTYCKKFLNDTLKEATPVWRPKDTRLGAEAADFAKKWAFRSNDNDANIGKTKTPFGAQRLNDADEEQAQEWNIDAVFRAAKAYARGRNGIALSLSKGVSCSQFVFYCYQAGAIAKAFGTANLSSSIWDQMNATGVHQKLFKKESDQFRNLTDPEIRVLRQKERASRIAPYKDQIESSLPATLKQTAKYMSADYLASVLKNSSDFDKVGYLLADPDTQRAVLVPLQDPARDWKYKDAIAELKALPV